MDTIGRRNLAISLTIVFIVLIVGFITWAVIHQINKKIIKPNESPIVDVMPVPATKEK